jgi:hypothetical protein
MTEPVKDNEGTVVVDSEYGTTATRSPSGGIIVDDKAEIDSINKEQALIKAQKEEALKTPEGLFDHRFETLSDRLESETEKIAKNAYEAYCKLGLKIFIETFSPTEEEIEEAKRRLTMGGDTDGALRHIEHGFSESVGDMTWMLSGHLDPADID